MPQGLGELTGRRVAEDQHVDDGQPGRLAQRGMHPGPRSNGRICSAFIDSMITELSSRNVNRVGGRRLQFSVATWTASHGLPSGGV